MNKFGVFGAQVEGYGVGNAGGHPTSTLAFPKSPHTLGMPRGVAALETVGSLGWFFRVGMHKFRAIGA